MIAVETGSRWYVFGKHYEVTGATERDGEPAVWLRNVKTGKPLRVPVIARLLAHNGREQS